MKFIKVTIDGSCKWINFGLVLSFESYNKSDYSGNYFNGTLLTFFPGREIENVIIEETPSELEEILGLN